MKKEKFDLLKFSPYCDAVDYYNTKKDFKTAWEECPRGDWMLWIAFKLGVNKRTLTLAKGLCAKTVIHLMTDKRSIDAVNAAIAYGKNEIGDKELAYAASAASAAYASASAAYAASAASAAYTAASAASVAYAADAAADAAYAAAHAATYAASAADAADAAYDEKARKKNQNQKQTADICRKILTKEVLKLTKKIKTS